MKKLPPPIENSIYLSIIGRLEELESENLLKVNGHHLAQNLTVLVSESLLSKQRRLIYDCLNNIQYLTVNEISNMCGVENNVQCV